jgi:hypothetical protein
MTATQQRTNLCWQNDFKEHLAPISVEKGLRVGKVLEGIGGKKMTVIRREWRMPNPLGPGPDAYAPPDRRAPEQSGARAVLHSQTSERSQSHEAPPGNLDALIRRVAGTSTDEIDRIIRELESMSDLLRNEGERVSRELAGYSSLSQSSVAAMKILSDSVKAWKDRSS